MSQAWHSDKGTRGNDSCQVCWNLDCLWDVTIWASIKTFLRMEEGTTVPKHNGKLRVCLQHLPNRVFEIRLHCGMYEVQRASKDIEVSYRG